MKTQTGAPIPRVDGVAKVTGKATYAADTPVAAVAHAVIVGSTIARGRVVAIDVRDAERALGVLAVLTHRNAPKLPGLAAKAEPNQRIVQALQDDEIRYDGQPIAVVVADTLERARYAAQLVRPRYEVWIANVEMDREPSPPYTPHPSGARPPPDSNRGDVDEALATAPVKIEQTYVTAPETHNPMEPHATVAVWQGDRLTLYDATQSVFGVRGRVADVFGLPKENVRTISRFLGGGFGGKGSPWSHVIIAAMAAKVTRRAVKLVVTRDEMFAFVGHRPRTVQRTSVGARHDGSLVAVKHEVLSYTSRFDEFMEPAAYSSRMLFACANVRTSHRLVRLDVGTPTFMRAPGEATGSFALGSAMDELSYALDMDPLDLALASYAETDLEENKPYSSKSLRACYEQAANRFGWARRPRAPRSMRDGRTLVGWGMATATYPARQQGASASVAIRADGRARVSCGTQDIGMGTYTIMTQIAAEALGLPVDRVDFELGDTAYPEAPISAGSMTASSAGSAVKKACDAARDEIVRAAIIDARSPLAGLDPRDVDARDGVLVSTRDASKHEDYAAIVGRLGREIVAKIDLKEKEERKAFSCHSFGVQMIEVRVDEDLGTVRVSRAVGAFACGKVLNRRTARSQLIGGVVWGIGLALQEKTVRDPRTGRLVTRDLVTYHLPVNADVPPIDVIMIDEDDPYVNEIGAKGMGEIGIVGVGAAIANAVFHATGRRLRELPITLDALL